MGLILIVRNNTFYIVLLFCNTNKVSLKGSFTELSVLVFYYHFHAWIPLQHSPQGHLFLTWGFINYDQHTIWVY